MRCLHKGSPAVENSPLQKTQVIRLGIFCVGGTGREQHGHAAGVANNSPVGCCLVRGFQRLGMSTKKAPPAGAPFAPPRLGGTGQEQCKSEPFVKNKGRVSPWRWYPAFFASGMVFRLAVWYTRLNKSEFTSTQTYKLLTIKLLYSMIL